MKLSICVPLLLALLARPVQAASGNDLPDPTRPALTEGAAAAGDAPAAAVLQSVILRPGGKPSAVISGQTVELGGEYGGARVTRIRETEVTLQSEAGKEVLKLTPAVEKSAASGENNGKSMAKKQKRNPGKVGP